MRKTLERLCFIDETSLNTKLVKTTGWAPVGQRLIEYAPFGHWHTQTFIAGLRHDGLTAPWVNGLSRVNRLASWDAPMIEDRFFTLNSGAMVSRSILCRGWRRRNKVK